MMNGAATSTLFSTSIHYRMITSIYVRVNYHQVRDLIGHNWLSVDVAVLMVTMSSGPKELTGVSLVRVYMFD